MLFTEHLRNGTLGKTPHALDDTPRFNTKMPPAIDNNRKRWMEEFYSPTGFRGNSLRRSEEGYQRSLLMHRAVILVALLLATAITAQRE